MGHSTAGESHRKQKQGTKKPSNSIIAEQPQQKNKSAIESQQMANERTQNKKNRDKLKSHNKAPTSKHDNKL